MPRRGAPARTRRSPTKPKTLATSPRTSPITSVYTSPLANTAAKMPSTKETVAGALRRVAFVAADGPRSPVMTRQQPVVLSVEDAAILRCVLLGELHEPHLRGNRGQ